MQSEETEKNKLCMSAKTHVHTTICNNKTVYELCYIIEYCKRKKNLIFNSFVINLIIVLSFIAITIYFPLIRSIPYVSCFFSFSIFLFFSLSISLFIFTFLFCLFFFIIIAIRNCCRLLFYTIKSKGNSVDVLLLYDYKCKCHRFIWLLSISYGACDIFIQYRHYKIVCIFNGYILTRFS